LPAFNAAATLGQALAAVCGVDHDRSEALPKSEDSRAAEVIVIDDASDDGTTAICRKFEVRLLQLTRNGGPAHARNLGARMARGDVLLFLDADTCLEAGALSKIEAAFEADPELDAVIGAYDDEPAAPGVISQYRNLLHCFVHRTARRQASTFWSGCGAIRTSVFVESHGFDESYRRASIEDLEFGYRLSRAGRKILMDPDIRVKHLKQWTLASMLQTDIWDRGIPWTRLILKERFMPADLNLGVGQRLSVTGVFLALLLGGAAVLAPPPLRLAELSAAAGALLAVLAINRRFYAFLRVRRGLPFTVQAAALHLLFYFYNGVAFLLGIVAWVYGSHPISELRRRLLNIVAG
jgi:glycosyltransferase involved in cell wall biosynthesis